MDKAVTSVWWSLKCRGFLIFKVLSALTLSPLVGHGQLGTTCLGLGHLQPPGDSNAQLLLCPSVLPTAHLDRQDPRGRQSTQPRGCKPLGWSLEPGLQAGFTVPAFSMHPPPPLCPARQLAPTALLSGGDEEAGILGWGVFSVFWPRLQVLLLFLVMGMGEAAAHRSRKHPHQHLRMESHVGTWPGLRGTQGRASAREERQRHGSQCQQPSLVVPSFLPPFFSVSWEEWRWSWQVADLSFYCYCF
jgi:hypothetical protein